MKKTKTFVEKKYELEESLNTIDEKRLVSDQMGCPWRRLITCRSLRWRSSLNTWIKIAIQTG